MNKHCCEEMNAHLQSAVSIKYFSKFREYGIAYADGGTSIQMIMFCPWCGSRLPSSVRDRWFEILGQLNMEPGDPDLPKELLSDEWWIKRKY